jgi:hypothetical protein
VGEVDMLFIPSKVLVMAAKVLRRWTALLSVWR